MSSTWPDLAVLELLVAVVETGSLASAAESVGMSQPSASRAITRFERRHGVVVERSPRGSRLTPEGALLVDWSRDLLAAASRFTVAAGALRGRLRTQLRVAASLTVAEFLVPLWLVRLGERAPDVHVHLTVANSDAVCEAVLSHEAEVGLIETGRTPAGLQSVVVGTDRLVLVVDPRHPWATRTRPVTPVELARTPLATREAGSGTRRILDEALASLGHTPAPAAYELSSNAAVRICAATGAAPAVLSELAVHDAVARGELVIVSTGQLDLSRRIRAVCTGGRRPVGAAAMLLDATTGPAR